MKKILKRIQAFTPSQSLIVIGIITVFVAVLLLKMGEVAANSKTEAAVMEHINVQTAVTVMLVDAGVKSLSEFNCDVDGLEEVKGVKAIGSNGTEYTLDQYLARANYPLFQSYDISEDGSVTVDKSENSQ